jgi:quercetin dioxygenase-like cupin family protein
MMPGMEAIATVHIDNPRVRVTTWSFAEGATTGWHRHEYDYVVVPIGDGTLSITGTDGAVTDVPLQLGSPYFREAGVEHDVRNATPGPFAFIEVELK